jgi:uncharacterized membrane protein YdfJ with MMPL/SSD domain
MKSVARWCYQHRFVVLAGWIVVLAATFFGASSTGSSYSGGYQLSGTPSAQAAALLQRAAPSVAGDTETIVFQAKTGHVTDPAVKAQIQQMLTKVAQLPYVTSIASPYSAGGAKQVSATGTIAFAQVNFSRADTAIPASEATQLVNLARAPNSPHLQVDVAGSLAASTNPASNQATFIGVGAAFVVLLIVFGSLLPALLPLISTGIALFAGLSVVAMLSTSLSMASFTPQLCTLIGLGIGIDYSLFILTRVRAGIRRGLSVQDAVTTAAGTAGRAVMFAGITVCVALLGMLTGFGPGFSGPLQLVAPVNGPADQAVFANVVTAAAHTHGVAATAGPQVLPAGPGHPAVAVADVYPAGSPQDASTSALIGTLRGTVIPQALHGSHLNVLVGGQTALTDDFAAQLSAKLPLFVCMVVALSFILLMVLFRSLVIPATAAVMNLFSAAAAFGVIVAVFQFGWLKGLFGIAHTGPIPPLVPILMFAVLFGLSMDYEVFLVSRMHEEWLKLRDNNAAVRIGQAISGRTITAAAAIMIVVFSSFVITTDRTIMMIGLGMAVAIFIDALLIRTVLVPAAMHAFGRANWALPSVLDRRLPRLNLEGSEQAGETPADRALDPAATP